MAGKEFHFNGIQAILTDIGVDFEQANMIASASQAVDDFIDEKLIVFDDGKLFYPVVTAHKSLDLDNMDSRDASNIWMPFHFYPNENGVCEPDTPNVTKLIKFVKDQISDGHCSDIEKNLYVGILLHILVDTYTHQNFMGLYCRHNDISSLDDKDSIGIGFLADALPAIGHGEALTYPDDMWRRWGYKNSKDDEQERDNKTIFHSITRKIPEYLNELGIKNDGMDETKAKKYKPIFEMEKNHEKEFDKITQSNVPEGTDLSYKHWKDLTLRSVQSKENTYIKKDSDTFESSEWFLFQKTAKDIRSFFKDKIFPELTIKTKIY
ncbi:MAG: hypothetical protein GY710_05590 [Desulfobacteraceae bacterium]|nr:hypothetical protein [Desulfobacteraceae bacterium]